MDIKTRDSRTLSLHLARALDEIGMNEETVACRRNGALQTEHLETLHYQCIEGKNFTSYHFGSQSEGTTTLDLHSDIDVLVCFDDYYVILDMSDWQKGKPSLLMLTEDTAPGYCRLKLIQADKPIPETDPPNEYYILDNHGNVVLKSISFASRVNEPRHGPATTLLDKEHTFDCDVIFAIRCREWPPEAKGWLSRARHGDWPTQDVLQKATMDDILLVPVGHKLSQYQEQEWRISCSLTERRLMFSMNMVQLKCYVVLKMLIKSYVTPRVEDSISSYHCKTAVMHCIEDSDKCLWQADNLVECVVMCLTQLMSWVKNLECPHFIIPKANVFAGKITDNNHNEVLTALDEIVNNIECHLLGISIDKLGLQLQGSINNPGKTKRMNSLPTAMVSYKSHVEFYRALLVIMRMSYVETCPLDLNSMISNLSQSVERLNLNFSSRILAPHERHPIEKLSQQMAFWLCSLECSAFISSDSKPSSDAKEGLKFCADTDISMTLKRASTLYCIGDFEEALQELLNVESLYRRNHVQPVCGCYAQLVYDDDFAKRLLEKDRHLEGSEQFAGCVMFSLHEAPCVPSAMRYEFYKIVGDDNLHKDPYGDSWMGLAVADSLPFMYFLKYLVLRAMGENYRERKRALDCLEQCLSDHNKQYMCHTETAWNLFGKCMEEEGDPYAFWYYVISLSIRRHNNAAVWHLGVACYHVLRKAGMCA